MATFNQVYTAVKECVGDPASVGEAISTLTPAEKVAYDVMFRIFPKRGGYEDWMRGESQGASRNQIFQAIALSVQERTT